MIAKFLILFTFLFQAQSFASSAKFNCTDKNLSVTGSLDESDGGKLDISGGEANLIFGNTEKTFGKKFYRHLRKNETESTHSFAKFDVKSEETRSKWLAKYYRFSMPKTVFKGQKSFVGYFAYYHDDKSNSPTEHAKLESNETVDAAELNEIQKTMSKENSVDQHDEYKMSCTLI